MTVADNSLKPHIVLDLLKPRGNFQSFGLPKEIRKSHLIILGTEKYLASYIGL